MSLIGEGRYEEARRRAWEALWIQYYHVEPPGYADLEEAVNIPAGEDKRPFVLANTYIGLTLQHEGMLEKAADRYMASLSADPSFCPARNNLAIALRMMGHDDAAVAEARRCLEYEPGNVNALRLLGDIHVTKREYSAGLRYYRRALEREPLNIALLTDMAWVLSTCEYPGCRDARESVQLAERAVRLGGGHDAHVVDVLAAAYARAGRFPEAVSAATAALEIASRTGDDANGIGKRLALYRDGVPFTRPAK
jgi:tetratricopeptide (TPR) repeat protein